MRVSKPLRQHARTPEEEQASAAQRKSQLGGAVQEVAQAFQVDSERISGARHAAPASIAPALHRRSCCVLFNGSRSSGSMCRSRAGGAPCGAETAENNPRRHVRPQGARARRAHLGQGPEPAGQAGGRAAVGRGAQRPVPGAPPAHQLTAQPLPPQSLDGLLYSVDVVAVHWRVW